MGSVLDIMTLLVAARRGCRHRNSRPNHGRRPPRTSGPNHDQARLIIGCPQARLNLAERRFSAAFLCGVEFNVSSPSRLAYNGAVDGEAHSVQITTNMLVEMRVARHARFPSLGQIMPLCIRGLALAALLATLAPVVAHAQDTAKVAQRDTATGDTVTVVRLRDGSVLFVRILAQDSTRLRVRTMGGTQIDVQRDQITSMSRTRGRYVGNEFWAEDPNGTRLLFTSTGRALGKGEGYVSAYFLFFPFVAYGVTDRLTIAAGTPVIPGLIGRAFYVAPKFTLAETNNASYAIGALSFALTEDVAAGTTGLLYGVGTWGNRDNAFTAGAGWGYRWGSDDSDLSSAPVIVLGGETRLSRRVKLVTENWFYTGAGAKGGIFSGGFRFIGDRLSTDFGLIGVAGVGEGDGGLGCCLPTVNFVWNFGRQRR